jgi:tetratricopeptide (TPR) repeat protein
MDEAYENAIKLEPNNPFTLNNYAYYLSLRKNQLERAKKMSRKTLDIAPDNGSFLDTYAWICFQLGQYQEALLYQEKAVEIEKEDKKTIYEHYGDILSKVGNIEKAVVYWQKSMDAGNSNKVLKQKITEKKYIESNE